MNHKLSDSQLEEMIKSAVNSSGPLPPDEKFSQLVSALRELQERRKAAMDSEPYGFTDGDRRGMIYKPEHSDRLSEPVPVYRHAQPAPAVPDDVLDALQKVARIRLDLNDFDGDRRGIADCLGDAEEALIEVVNRRAAMLQAQPQNAPQNIPEIIPDCWCRTCRPVTLNDMRFVVCPDCGNKRCPRANDHRNACTGSNEPGQEGSEYPAAPQEVPDGK
ncbi:hypothetical protein [Klebsiella variicola]|uniref:hypothetical protein n=1 Tax=Klebsiella variicola TaxID=244366 RepID=UPI003131EAA8